MSFLLIEILGLPMAAIASEIPSADQVKQAIAADADHSRETETCIHLRGCGRRERT